MLRLLSVPLFCTPSAKADRQPDKKHKPLPSSDLRHRKQLLPFFNKLRFPNMTLQNCCSR